jgi:hypothetical protein
LAQAARDLLRQVRSETSRSVDLALAVFPHLLIGVEPVVLGNALTPINLGGDIVSIDRPPRHEIYRAFRGFLAGLIGEAAFFSVVVGRLCKHRDALHGFALAGEWRRLAA